MDFYEFAKRLKAAAKLQEESWVEYQHKYDIPLVQAIHQTAKSGNEARLMLLLLGNCWDDTLNWCNDVVAAVDGPST